MGRQEESGWGLAGIGFGPAQAMVFEGVEEALFQVRVARVDAGPTQAEDEVGFRKNVVLAQAEQLAQAPLGQVALRGGADASGGRDAYARK